MPARLIDGRALGERIKASIRARASALRSAGAPPRLDAILVGAASDSPARVYAANQARMCGELGIEYHLHDMAGSATYEDVAGRVLLLNSEPIVRAVMVHLPLPERIDAYRIQSLIAPEKDVEGVNPANIGNIVYGRSSLAPCTALAVLRMIESTGTELQGRTAVVVGASDIVGKPIAVMLMRLEATVISCNKHTRGIQEYSRRADVLVAAAGVPGLVKADWVKPGAIVIDVGIHRVPGADGKLQTVGDVAFDEVSQVASYITPVPGGVGPMTVAMLLENTVSAAEK